MLQCSFCGKQQSEVKKLITGNEVAICSDCVVLCMGVVEETLDQKENNKLDKEKELEKIDFKSLPKPMEMKSMLDDYVIGHDETKKYFLSLFTIIIKDFR